MTQKIGIKTKMECKYDEKLTIVRELIEENLGV